MKKRFIFIPILTLILSGCTFVPISSSRSNDDSENSLTTSDESQNPTSGDGSDTPISQTSTSIDPVDPLMSMYSGFTYPSEAKTFATAAYYEFWHPNTKIIVDISGTETIFNLMDQYGHASSTLQDLYWPVDVTISVNGTAHHFDEVGMRRKGNTSRGYYFMHEGRVADVFSFKLSFNEVWDEPIYDQFGLRKTWVATDEDYIARDERKFLDDIDGKNGMDKLDIKMYKTNDESMINQAFAFSLFQKGGLIAPNSTLGKFNMDVDGRISDFGVAVINETIDKDLLQRYFNKDDAKGDLYKVGWGPGRDGWNKGNLNYQEYLDYPNMIGEEDKFSEYVPRYDAKEFDALNPHANLINLMRVLSENEGRSPSEYAANLEAVVDIDSFLNFAALSYLTGNEDDMRNNGNNYYIFFNPGENNKAYFIPYDYDWALGIGFDEHGGLTLANISPFHSKLQGNGRNWQDNRLFLYTIIDTMSGFNIDTNESWQQSYYSIIVSYLEGDFYQLDTFNDMYARYQENYKNDTNVLSLNSQEVYNNFGGTHLFSDYISLITDAVAKNPPA